MKLGEGSKEAMVRVVLSQPFPPVHNYKLYVYGRENARSLLAGLPTHQAV